MAKKGDTRSRRLSHLGFNSYHQRASVGKYSEKTALMAAEIGNLEAVKALVEAIPDSNSKVLQYTYSAPAYRLRALRFIRFRGSNDEIKAWFEEHSDKLVFDHFTKQFVLSQTALEPTRPTIHPLPWNQR